MPDQPYTIAWLPTPPPIDADWSHPAWEPTTTLGPLRLSDGAPAFWGTLVKLGYDAERLYIAFLCVDQDIWGTFRKHDDPLYQEEVVEAFLDPSGEGKRYYEIELSPHNVVIDGIMEWTGPAKKVWHPEWDCEGLQTATQIMGELDTPEVPDRWWTAVLSVPFAGLGVPAPEPGVLWRANLYRIERDREGRGDEYQAAWPPQEPGARADFHVPQRFGHLVFGPRP